MEVWEKDAFNRGEKRDSALSADKTAALIRERRKPKFRCNSKASVFENENTKHHQKSSPSSADLEVKAG